jgi:adenosylcobinamide kinase/adenosylcobinamide-phosphate guanylyltransferase
MILVTGGCRSGKSEYGEKLVESMGNRRLYVATGKVFDAEMAYRVEKHQERRGELWITHEGYRGLEALDYRGFDGILLDSVTSMVTNLLFDYIESSETAEQDYDRLDYSAAEAAILEEIRRLAAVIKEEKLPYVLVTDEIGLGVVPETPLGRGFRDILGRVNQFLASEAGQVYIVISGIPVCIKAE